MAGTHYEHSGGSVEGQRESSFEFRVQRGDLRRQPRLRLSLGPKQLVGEFGQSRRLPAVPDDQAMSKFLLPALEFAPDVPV